MSKVLALQCMEPVHGGEQPEVEGHSYYVCSAMSYLFCD